MGPGFLNMVIYGVCTTMLHNYAEDHIKPRIHLGSIDVFVYAYTYICVYIYVYVFPKLLPLRSNVPWLWAGLKQAKQSKQAMLAGFTNY